MFRYISYIFMLVISLGLAYPNFSLAQEGNEGVVGQAAGEADPSNQQDAKEADTGEEAAFINKELLESIIIDEISVTNEDVNEVLDLISVKSGLTFTYDNEIQGNVSLYLKQVNVLDALRIILDMHQLVFKIDRGAVRVMTPEVFEARYGYPFETTIMTQVTQIIHSDPPELLSLLEDMKSDSGKIIFEPEQNSLILIDTPETVNAMVVLIEEMDVPLETHTFRLKYADATVVGKEIEYVLSEDAGDIQINEAENSLVITDTHLKMKEIKELVGTLDEKEKEILVQIQAFQVFLNEEHQSGVDWEAIVSNYQSMNIDSVDEKSRDELNVSLGTLTAEDVEVLVEALDTVGVVNQIFKKKNITSNERQTQFTVKVNASGADLPVDIKEDGEPQTIKLSLTPEYKEDGVIALAVYPQLDIQNKPVFTIDQADAAFVDVEDSSTVVVGGFFKDVIVGRLKKIPLLGDLPFLGFAFRMEGRGKQRTEVILLVTPSIILPEPILDANLPSEDSL